MEPKDQIKNKIDIAELIAEYIQLKPAGSGSFKALCPFHQEKAPSFYVSKAKQIWHCFGCGEGGDQFAFVQKIEGMDFPEALRLLAQKAGVELPHFDKKEISQKQKLTEINDLAARFFHKILLESSVAKEAREYMEKRNLGQDMIDEFMLGYSADEWDLLLNFLTKKGYSEDDINRAGLAVQKERGSGFYDRFRGRIMFPIQNIQARCVGFTARSLKGDEQAKYINTPQTPIYNKSEILYGLDKAKREISQQDLAIIVEGNMDAITSHRMGVKNVVASSGTALTQPQINTLKRYTTNLAFSFDADSAGQAAAKRGIDMALAQGMTVSVILMPDGIKDPDELINKDVESWKKAIADKVNVMEWYFGLAKQKHDLKTALGKKEASKFLLIEINKIHDRVEQTHWLQQLGKLINVGEDILRQSLPSSLPKVKKAEPARALHTKSREEQAAEKFLGILLNWPDLVKDIESSFHPEYLSGQSYQQIYKNVVLYYNEAQTTAPKQDGESSDFERLSAFFERAELDEQAKALFPVMAVAGERDWQGMEQDLIQKELLLTSQFLEKIYKQQEKQMLAQQMKEFEASGEHEKAEQILRQFQQYE